MNPNRPRAIRGVMLLGLFVSLVVAGCSKVPLTGRKQLNVIPASTMLTLSSDEYGTFLKSNTLSSDQENTRLLRKVGRNIQGAVERYLRENNLAEELKGYNWEFNLVENKEANAWCMPGGKVVFYTGILPVTRDEAGMAVVMGHEVAHAVARHGQERMSQGLVAQFGGMALSEALSKKPQETRQLLLTAFGVGVQVGALLPFSRLQESEADRLGLIFMAMAGYDPHEAVTFWQRMAGQKQGSAPPAFLSTHPSDQARIQKIEQLLPEALRHYQKPAGER